MEIQYQDLMATKFSIVQHVWAGTENLKLLSVQAPGNNWENKNKQKKKNLLGGRCYEQLATELSDCFIMALLQRSA